MSKKGKRKSEEKRRKQVREQEERTERVREEEERASDAVEVVQHWLCSSPSQLADASPHMIAYVMLEIPCMLYRNGIIRYSYPKDGLGAEWDFNSKVASAIGDYLLKSECVASPTSETTTKALLAGGLLTVLYFLLDPEHNLYGSAREFVEEFGLITPTKKEEKMQVLLAAYICVFIFQMHRAVLSLQRPSEFQPIPARPQMVSEDAENTGCVDAWRLTTERFRMFWDPSVFRVMRAHGFTREARALRRMYRKHKERSPERKFDLSEACAWSGCKRREEETESFKRCSNCRVEKYCSDECQRSDWHVRHKKVCESMCQLHRNSLTGENNGVWITCETTNEAFFIELSEVGRS